MKKMFVVSIVLAAALVMGCSKKKAATTPQPPDGAKTEEMKEGEKGNGVEGETTPDPAADPCAAPK